MQSVARGNMVMACHHHKIEGTKQVEASWHFCTAEF